MRISIDKADKEFSLYIRKRDKWRCLKCNTNYEENPGGLSCSHYWSRRHEGTRFEPDNCISLCYGCHTQMEGDKQGDYKYLMEKIVGKERMKTLEIQANTYCKKDRKMKYLIFKKLNEQL